MRINIYNNFKGDTKMSLKRLIFVLATMIGMLHCKPAYAGNREVYLQELPRLFITENNLSNSEGDPEQFSYIWFRLNGYSHYVTCGIMGNICAESDFNTGATSPGGKYKGLIQMYPPEFKKFQSYASSKGKHWKDIYSQLEWTKIMMTEKDREWIWRNPAGNRSRISSYTQFINIKDPGDAAREFMCHVERMKGGDIARESVRVSKAYEYDRKYSMYK